MDFKIISILISASVALFIAVLNHFVVTPVKESRNRKREQLKTLYAPMYSLICIRISLVKEFSLSSKKLLLGSVDKEYQSREYMETFFLNHSGYSSNELIDAWVNYAAQFADYEKENTENFVVTLVKEYNLLKKKLGLPYDKDELKTGIPECIKEYREFL
ncbi:hypothetical protein [Paraliobacillus sp. X-1268]|uniref:hypothetical protein n=1 Tax=Paraliobacillus sp. X-1268 TaxID=2213193 RepID=UPI000E3E324F|nr:hypothetical protein [Paraliobacillus sp. X-1268]